MNERDSWMIMRTHRSNMASFNGSNMARGSSKYRFIVVVIYVLLLMAGNISGEEFFKEPHLEPHAVLKVVGNRKEFVAMRDSIQLAYNLSDWFPLPANVSVRLIHLDGDHLTTGSEDDDDENKVQRSKVAKTSNRKIEDSKTTDERLKSYNDVVFSEAFLLDESQRSGELQIQCEVFDRSGNFIFQLSTSSYDFIRSRMTRVRSQPASTNRRQLHRHMTPSESISAKIMRQGSQHKNKKQTATNNTSFAINNIEQLSIDQPDIPHRSQSNVYKTDDDDNNDDVVIGQTEPFVISWPSLNVSLPRRWISLSNLDHASLHISLAENFHPGRGETWCDANQGSGARFSVEIRYFGTTRKPQNVKHHHQDSDDDDDDDDGDYTVKSVLVNSVNFSSFSQLVGIELMFNCSLFDRAGVYKAIVRSLLYQTRLVAISNPMVVRWSGAYRLAFLGSSDTPGNNASSLLPCQGTGLGIRYYRPTCSGSEDRIRLYRINLVFKSKAIRQGDLVYVTEKNVSPTSGHSDWSESVDIMTNRVTFQCDLFSQSAPGYCFKYVSTARSGFLRSQSQICLPTFYNPEFLTDGSWSPWSKWSSCSSSCGRGVQSRFRTCDNPSPLPSGRYCKGKNVETAPCDRLCPIEMGGDSTSDSFEPSDFDVACPCGCQLTSERGIISYPPSNAPSSPSSSSSSLYNCSPRLRHRLHLQHQPIVWRIRSSRDTVIRLTYFLGESPRGDIDRLRRSSPSSSPTSSSSFRGDLRKVRQDERAADTIRHKDEPKIPNKRIKESVSGNLRKEFNNEYIDHSGDIDYNDYYNVDDKLDFSYLKKNRLVKSNPNSGRATKPDTMTPSIKVRDGATENAPLLSFSTTRGQKKVVTSSGNEITIEYQPIAFPIETRVSDMRRVQRSLISNVDIADGNDDEDDDDGNADKDTSDNYNEEAYYYGDDDDDDDDVNYPLSETHSFSDFQAIYISLPSPNRGAGRALFNATDAERQSYSSGFVVGVLIGSILGFLVLLVLILVACRYNMSALAKRRHVKFQVGQMLMDSCSMERSDIRLTTCQRSKKGRKENEAEMACYTFDEVVSTSPGESPSKDKYFNMDEIHTTARHCKKGVRTMTKPGCGRSNQRGSNFSNCRLSSSYSEPVLGEADFEICAESTPVPDFKRPDVCPTLDQKYPGDSSPGQSLHSTTSPTSVPSARLEPVAYHLYEAVNQPITPAKQAIPTILNEKDILFQYSIKHQPDGNTPIKTPGKIIRTDALTNAKGPLDVDLGNQMDKVNLPILKANNSIMHNYHSRANNLLEESKIFNRQQNHPLKQFNRCTNNKFLPLRKTDKSDKSPKSSGTKRNPSQSGGSRQSSCASSPSRKSNSFSGGLVAKSSGHNSSGCASSSDDGLEYDDYVANLPGSYFTMDPLAYTLTWSKTSSADQNGDESKGVEKQYEII